MAEDTNRVDDLVKRIPPATEIRRRLQTNVRETRLLRQMLRLAEQREKFAEGGRS